LNVLSEIALDGSSLITSSDDFSFSVNAQVFRVPVSRFPPPPGSIDLKTLTNPALTTCSGKYSGNLSAIISERKKVSKGVYVVIPSTFNP